MKRKYTTLFRFGALLGCCAAMSACASGQVDVSARNRSAETTSLSAFQMIGTHNSYHIEPPEAVFDLMRSTDYIESEEWPADSLIPALSYTHLPLDAQLDLGIRLFEFDMHDDPEGGRFANPGVYGILKGSGSKSQADIDPEGLLTQPGIKVFHAADTDVLSHCLTLNRCFEIIKAWSGRNPGHFPVFIQLETKVGRKPAVADAYEPATASPFTDESWTRVHDTIFSVFPAESVVTPREVRGAYTSVNAAVRARGWPSLQQMRGKIVFLLLDEDDRQREYIDFAGGDEGMVLFPSLDRNNPYTAWLRRDNPKESDIARRVGEGFLVYTRADKHTHNARDRDYGSRDRALLSGAQLVATDFPLPDRRYSEYSVTIGGKYVGCNRVYAPQACARND